MKSMIKIETLDEAMRAAEVMSKSGLVPQDFKGKPANILVAMQWGSELGLSPMQSMQAVAVINNKPCMYGDALLALVRADDRCVGVEETIAGKGDDRAATCVVKRQHAANIETISRTFDVIDAKKAHLWNKNGPWAQYPDRMLAMRARGFALRDAFPDVLRGIITTEEAADFPPVPAERQAARDWLDPSMKDITPPAEETQEERSKEIETILEAPPAPAVEVETESEWLGMLPGKDAIPFARESDWVQWYEGIQLKLRECAKEDSSVDLLNELMSKLHALEEENDATLDRINPDTVATLRDQRIKYNRQLGAAKQRAAP